MTNRQQSAFFLAIIFLFTTGIGLVIYRQYDQYYQQKTAIELEAALADKVPAKNLNASTTPEQIVGWKVYTNTQYGFQYSYPSDSETDSTFGSIGLQIENRKLDPSNLFISGQPGVAPTGIEKLVINNKTWYSFYLADFPQCSDRFVQTEYQGQLLEMRFGRCEQNADTYLKLHPGIMDMVIQSFKFSK